MRFGILTSVEIRHRYFVRALADAVDVRAVGYERTGYHPADATPDGLTDEQRAIVTRHFTDRTETETRYFGDRAEFLEPSDTLAVRHIAPGELNTDATLSFLESAGVDAVVIYGTNLIKPPLLDRYAGRMLNMHLGLSPYYRGTATNFYPLVNGEPEFVGATIHLIDAGIDSGPIVRHARPDISAGDTPHTLGCKAILAGIEAMIRSLGELESVRLRAVRQWPVKGSRLYLRRDYHPRDVVRLYQRIDDGLFKAYAAKGQGARQSVRLIEDSVVDRVTN